jgi:hypothetical protein
VLLEPLVELNDFERVGGRGEGLGEERIGIESDGCNERVELVGKEFLLAAPELSRMQTGFAPGMMAALPGCLLER